MGLDLEVLETSNYSVDDNGNGTWTTKEIFNFRNCYNLLSILGAKRGGYDNNMTLWFTDEDIYDAYEELISDRQEYIDRKAFRFRTETDEQYEKKCKRNIAAHNDEIEVMEDFLKQENISKETLCGKDYDIRANW